VTHVELSGERLPDSQSTVKMRPRHVRTEPGIPHHGLMRACDLSAFDMRRSPTSGSSRLLCAPRKRDPPHCGSEIRGRYSGGASCAGIFNGEFLMTKQ